MCRKHHDTAHVLVLVFTQLTLSSSTLLPFLTFSAFPPLGSVGSLLPLHLDILRFVDLLPFVHTSMTSLAWLSILTSSIRPKSNSSSDSAFQTLSLSSTSSLLPLKFGMSICWRPSIPEKFRNLSRLGGLVKILANSLFFL